MVSVVSGSELARLRWLVQLHAKIERRLQRLLDATGEQAPCLDEEGQLVQVGLSAVDTTSTLPLSASLARRA